MGRVFTINFPYKGRTCPAIVSFKSDSYDMSFLVRFLDKDISHVIPGARIEISLAEGIISHNQIGKSGEDLINLTTEAISKHLLYRDL